MNQKDFIEVLVNDKIDFTKLVKEKIENSPNQIITINNISEVIAYHHFMTYIDLYGKFIIEKDRINTINEIGKMLIKKYKETMKEIMKVEKEELKSKR